MVLWRILKWLSVRFVSETDTEVIVRMLESALAETALSAGDRAMIRIKAVKETIAQINSRNSIAVMMTLLLIDKVHRFVLGVNQSEYFLVLDALCFASWTAHCFMVDDGGCVSISQERTYIEGDSGDDLNPKWQSSRLEAEA